MSEDLTYVRWTPEEDAILIKAHEDGLHLREIAKLLPSRSAKSIGHRKNTIKLTIPEKRMIAYKDPVFWSIEETNILRNEWPIHHDNTKVASLIPTKTLQDVIRKARSLKLEKSKEVKEQILEARRKLVIDRNRTVGRPMSHEFAREEASKYGSKQEFKKYDNSVYTYARREGILDEICSHMITGDTFNYPQTFLFFCIQEIFKGKTVRYNDRSVLKPKEIDVYVVEDMIGFEYDGVMYHKEREEDTIKDALCEEKGIKLYRIKEVSKHHPEKVIITALTDFGFDVSGLNVDELIKKTFSKKISPKMIHETIAKYKTLKDFRNGERALYNFLVRKRMLSTYADHLVKKKFTKEELISEIKKCSSKGEFRLNEKTKSYYGTMMKKKDPEIMSAYLSLPDAIN